jgi:putative transposase
VGIEVRYKKPSTRRARPRRPIYPYLLPGTTIERANQVRAMNVTHIPVVRGFVYRGAVLDWHTRRVVAHRVSIPVEADLCIVALKEAITQHGKTKIMHTAQFTSLEFTDTLRRHGIAIRMDGRGRCQGVVDVQRRTRWLGRQHRLLQHLPSAQRPRAAQTAFGRR